MLHSLKTVLERLPKGIIGYDLIFIEVGSVTDTTVCRYRDVEWEDIQGAIEELCNTDGYEVVTILWDLDLRYYLNILLRRKNSEDN